MLPFSVGSGPAQQTGSSSAVSVIGSQWSWWVSGASATEPGAPDDVAARSYSFTSEIHKHRPTDHRRDQRLASSLQTSEGAGNRLLDGAILQPKVRVRTFPATMSLGACSLARAPLLCRSDRTRIFLVRRTAAQYVSPKAPIRSLASSSFRRAEFYGRGTRTKEPYTIRTTAREIASEPIRTFVISSRYIATMVVAAVVVYGLFSQTVPVTGRRSFNVMSDGFVRWWNQGAAEQIIRDVQRQGGKLLPEWDPRSRAVRRAMERLIPVSGMQDLDWEVHVIADDRTFPLLPR